MPMHYAVECIQLTVVKLRTSIYTEVLMDMDKKLKRMSVITIALSLLLTAGCYSKTVKETTPPVVITQPPTAQTSTTTTTNPDDGSVVRHSTTTYSNP